MLKQLKQKEEMYTMVSGLALLTGLCIFEIILVKIVLGKDELKAFHFQEFYDLNSTEKRKQS